MTMRDEIDIKTDLELAEARELRETAIRADKPDENAIQQAEARFEKAQKDRLKYLKEQIQALEENAKSDPAPAELIEKFNLGDYLTAEVTHRPLDGAMAELNQELNLKTDRTERGIVFPWDVYQAVKDRDIELSVDANTLVTNVTHAQPLNRGPITPLIYARNARDFLGIDMPLVAAGKQSYPYLSSGASVAFVGEGSQVDSVAAAFSKVEITPTRLTGAFTLSVDSLLDVGAEVQNILETDLAMAMSDTLDGQVITGNGTTPNLKGIMTQLGNAVAADGDTGSGADDAAFTWQDYRRVATAHLDDKLLRESGELRLLIGTKTLDHGSAEFNSATVPTMDGIEGMQNKGVSTRYSGRLAAPAAATSSKGSLQEGIILAAQHARNCILATWQQATLLVDPFSQGRKGIIEISLSRYVGLGYRRSGSSGIEGWKKLFFTLSDKT